MTNLDTILGAATGHAVDTADLLINAAFIYGPGVLATAALAAAWHSCRWAPSRYRQWTGDRADRRYYTAVNARLHQVADNTDQIIARAGDQLADQLLQQIYANGFEGEK